MAARLDAKVSVHSVKDDEAADESLTTIFVIKFTAETLKREQ